MSLQGKRYEFGYAKCYDCPKGTNYDCPTGKLRCAKGAVRRAGEFIKGA